MTKNSLYLTNKSLLSGIKIGRLRFHFLFLIIFSACIGILLYINVSEMLSPHMHQVILNKKLFINNNNSNNDDFLIKTPGCRITYMDPFDYAVKDFLLKETPPICNKGLPAMIHSNSTSIFIVNSSIDKYIDQNNNTFKCCYKTFTRKEPKNKQNDNKINYSDPCVLFNQSARIHAEFIKVKCYDRKNTFYQDFFSFVPLKSKKKTSQKILAEEKPRENPLNVLIIGIDGVSRLNLHRQMPKTVEYLKNLSAIELLGYNKVADNTFSNLIPVLTGLSEDELKENCWQSKNDRFDKCPFIWKNYKENGFTTAFGEDASWMGIFNNGRKGFKKQPTDYMWSSFNRVSEKLIGNSYNKNGVAACVGAREVYKVFLNYIWNFVQKMHTEKVNYFGFYWGSSLTHDYLNKPNLGDNDYYNLFKKINDSQYLNNTVMIVMSDHGIRWGNIRQTYQGQMEERLPFLFMVLPEWYKRQYNDAYNNLLKNVRRLTTPFDLHETLKDLLHPLQLNADYLITRDTGEIWRGYSFFNEIPQTRTCEDAGIASHWCTCQQSQEISRNDDQAVKGALFAVNFINRRLQDYTQCSYLRLSNIISVRIMTYYSDIILSGYNIKDYIIIFKTVPGYALFEVTVRSSQFDEILSTNYQIEKMEVIGTISRLNLYRKQSACIADFSLKLYCYCVTFIDNNSK